MIFQFVTPFSPTVCKRVVGVVPTKNESSNVVNRHNFVTSLVAAGVSTCGVMLPSQPASARGRATLELALDRYYPRIITGGVFYANDLKKAIEKNDWNAIKVG